MPWAEILTAILFYLPFLLTVVFGIFALTIGILAIFSGTVAILLLAAYGSYAIARDTGALEICIEKCKAVWSYLSHDIERNIQESFLLKDLEKLPSGPALYLCHPHGLIGYSWMLHFCYGISPWPTTKQKPIVAIHSILFRLPIVRDVLEQFRCIEAKEETIKRYLNQGKSVAIVTGGIEEMQYNGDTTIKIILKKRKGYARIAKDCKVPIVPMFTVGENELFPSEAFWLWKGIQRVVYRWTGIHVPLPTWKSMKSWGSIIKTPLGTPVETFVLGVIETQEKNELHIRNECVEKYKDFFVTKKLNATVIA